MYEDRIGPSGAVEVWATEDVDVAYYGAPNDTAPPVVKTVKAGHFIAMASAMCNITVTKVKVQQ